ncbi:acyl-CoA dehydrogenase family protein [Streptomyces sp. NPDC088785]|uniref:acyl-CoA dehydrogenase family protein n=1 Tax=Streptomyces sp. NPDC088785 TaxID=3365897 RepID=UPI0037F2665E
MTPEAEEATMPDDALRLSRYLRTRASETDPSGPLTLHRPDTDGPTVWFTHPVGGSLLAYHPLIQALGDHHSLGFEASLKTLDEGGRVASVQELARRYTDRLDDRAPRVDVLCGWSFGGALAWETGCLLAERGQRPAVVLLDSTWAERDYTHWTETEALNAFVRDARRTGGDDAEHTVGTEEEAAAVLGMDLDTFSERFAIFAHGRRLIGTWTPTPGDLDVVSVRAAASLTSDWRTVTTGSVRVVDLPGDHYGLLRPGANVNAIEEVVRSVSTPAAGATPVVGTAPAAGTAPAITPPATTPRPAVTADVDTATASADVDTVAPGAPVDENDLRAALADVVSAPAWRDLVVRARRMDADAIATAYRELGGRGLLTPDWPVEFGGAGLSTRLAIELFEGFCTTGLPDLVHALSVQIVGNFVLKSGSPRLRRELLPRLSRGEEFATVLYSEPRAGSDLAALRTRAERRGDRYVLNGVKVFSIYSDISGSALVAARTAQEGHKYDGITLFVIDLAADGVSVELVDTVQRERMCRVRLRDVEVDSWRMLGEEGQGWALLDGALAIERTGIDHVVRAQRWLRALRGADTRRTEGLERLQGQVECATTLARAATEVFLRADVKATDTAVAKLYTSETCQQVGHEVLRRWSSLEHASGLDDLTREELFSALTESPGLTLSAGTSEMMLATVAADLKVDAGRRCLDILHRFGDELVDTALDVLEPEGAAVRAAPLFAPSERRRTALADVLRDTGLDLAELPEDEGGLGLGLPVGCALSLSLGYLGYEHAYQPCPTAATRAGAGASPHCSCRPCRIRRAGYVLGLGIGLFRVAWEHACAREQFGRRLVDVDALMFPLIRGYAELTALGVRLHELADEDGTTGDTADTEGPLRRFELVAEDALVRVVRSAMQVLGAQGITEWSVASRYYLRCAEHLGTLDHRGTAPDE